MQAYNGSAGAAAFWVMYWMMRDGYGLATMLRAARGAVGKDTSSNWEAQELARAYFLRCIAFPRWASLLMMPLVIGVLACFVGTLATGNPRGGFVDGEMACVALLTLISLLPLREPRKEKLDSLPMQMLMHWVEVKHVLLASRPVFGLRYPPYGSRKSGVVRAGDPVCTPNAFSTRGTTFTSLIVIAMLPGIAGILDGGWFRTWVKIGSGRRSLWGNPVICTDSAPPRGLALRSKEGIGGCRVAATNMDIGATLVPTSGLTARTVAGSCWNQHNNQPICRGSVCKVIQRGTHAHIY